MSGRIRRLIEAHPLAVLLGIGLILRLIAVWFARGYMATDDHFQVIELAAEWLRGHDNNLPGDTQFYRSLLYPGTNWALMVSLNKIGITHPDAVMLINRLAHALFSLWTIVLVYKTALLLSDRRAAWTAGLIMAAHGLMPFISVRNLIESVSMPFLLWGVYQLTRTEIEPTNHTIRSSIIAGLAFGLAFVIRWQVATAIIGVGLYLLYRKRWKTLLVVTGVTLAPIVAQGLWDWSWHGLFLGSLWKYIAHNRESLYNYVVGPWYRYVLLILGIFIPPFSFILIAAMARWWKRLGVLPWATLVFLVAHSAVPGKQERFILPVFPLLVIMGAVGLHFWQGALGDGWNRWIRRGWLWFWAGNAALLVLFTLDYGNRAKVESLLAMYDRGDATGVVVDVTEHGSTFGLPEYYLDGGQLSKPRPTIYQARRPEDLDTLRLRAVGQLPPPVATLNYVIVFSQGRIEEHLALLRARLGDVEVIRHIGPSLAERLLVFFNPRYHHSREAWVCRLVRLADRP